MNNQSNSSKVDNAKLKLLTLLNVVAAKPINTSSTTKQKTPIERDWTSLARSSNLKSTTTQIDSTKEIVLQSSSGEQCDESSNHVEEEEDTYSYHFGPQTILSNPSRIQSSKHPENWKLISNTKLDEKRIIQYSIDTPLSDPDPDTTDKIGSSSKPMTKTITKARNQWIENLTPRQSQVFENLKRYEDLWFTNVPYNQSRADFRISLALWTIQHVKETRSQVLKNDKYLARLAQQNHTTPAFSILDPTNPITQPKPTSEIIEPDLRDQGFTRPKVLILLPFRSSAYDWVNKLIRYTASSHSASQKVGHPKGIERFEREYTLPKGTMDKLETEEAALKYTEEHRMIFAGNVDDEFKLGIQLDSKMDQLKLYSDFFQSDWIIGSPVGLRKLIEKEGDADFLSSIEITIADQMDVMLMQNWDHVEFIFDQLNQIPSKPRDTDFSRVKPWYLDQQAKHLRQTILLSSLTSPEQTSLFRRLTNQAGKSIHFFQQSNHQTLRSSSGGVLWKIRKGLQQTWWKFGYDDDEQQEEGMRLKCFKEQILRPLLGSAMVKEGLGGIMIFVPDYFQFVKLEEYMRSLEEVKFVGISEYSTPSEIMGARSAFFNQHVSFLILTERFHFYHRYKLRGAKEMIFYGPPIHADYYVEFCDEYPFIGKDDGEEDVKVKVLFSDLDGGRIERIVGLEWARKMVRGDGMKFTFV